MQPTKMLAPHRPRPLRRLGREWALLLPYLIVGLGALSTLFPFLWMISTSFKPRGEIMAFPPTLWPRTWTLQNYENVFEKLDLVRIYLNTANVSIIKTLLMVYTGILLGYVFAKFRFWGRTPLFYLILFTMILPFEIYMIPLYQMMVDANLANTHLALIVPHVISAYAVFLFRQFMFSLPDELLDAARIDGAGEWYIFHRIVLPLSGPVLATAITFYFMWSWNDFLWPLIVISDGDKQMLPVALASFVAQFGGSDFGLVLAGNSLASLPVLAVFILFQRYLVQGIVLSGFK
jgi:multiple sugar transport system permease protein